ncbi:MAG TPA: Fe-S cluster assembly protein SufD [Acidimicrobiia bacterium]
MSRLDHEAMQRASIAGPGGLARRRQQAWEIYEKLAMPSSTEEVWRYVDLDFDLAELELANGAGIPLSRPEDGIAAGIGNPSGVASIVDGTVTTAQSASAATVTSVGEVGDDGWIDARYGTLVHADLDKFSAAHVAFSHDGLVVKVPSGVALAEPVYVDVQATGDALSLPHVVVDCEDGAEASVVVNYRSGDETAAVVVPHLELHLGDGVNLAVSLVQNWGYRTVGIAQARARVGRDSTLRLAEAGLGGKLARFQLAIDLEGRGSSAHVIGAYFGERDQVLDYRYLMHHAGLNTSSDMFLKGAVEDTALSVFTGLIRIDEGAQRTDAYQTNRNLILSEGAAAQSVPNLEILANDVKCGHGSTVGPLDAEQRYYLMSRGLERTAADRLQVRGFFEDALGRFPDQRVAEPIRRWINGKFLTAQREGRV